MTITTERDVFATQYDNEGVQTLNTDALYALGLWVQEDQASLERVFNWANAPMWDQGTWGRDDEKEYAMPDQGDWSGALDALNPTCGAAFCLAGNAVAYSKEYRADWGGGHGDRAIPIEPTGEIDTRGMPIYQDVPGAQHTYVPDAAQKILGLDDTERHHLFEEGNSAEYILVRINGFCEARGLPLLFPDFNATTMHMSDWSDPEAEDTF